MNEQEVCRAIIAKNGINYQATIAIEELAELTKELTKLIRSKGSPTKICEEIADVEICLTQLKLIMPNSKAKIVLYKEYKLKRLQLLYIEGSEG